MIRNNFFWTLCFATIHFQLTHGALLPLQQENSSKRQKLENGMLAIDETTIAPLDQDLEQQNTSSDKKEKEAAVATKNGEPQNYGGDPLLSMLPLAIQQLIKEYYVHPMQFYPVIAGTIVLPEKHGGLIQAIAITPDASTIVSASFDHTAKIWRDNKCVATLNHTDKVLSAAIAKDGNTIVTGSLDRTIKIWNGKGELQHVINVGGAVTSVAIASDGTVAACYAGFIRIYGQQRLLSQIIDRPSRFITIAQDDSLVAACLDSTAVWRHNDIKKTVLQGHTKSLTGPAIAPDFTIVTGSDDATAKIWVNGQCTATLAHPMSVRTVTIAPYKGNTLQASELSQGNKSQPSDDNIIVTGCFDGRTRIWKDDECWVVFPPEYAITALTSDGTMVTGNGTGLIIIHTIDQKLLKMLYKLDLETLEQLKQSIKSVPNITLNQNRKREVSAEQWCQSSGHMQSFYRLWNIFDELGIECRRMLLALPANDRQQLHDILLVIHKQRCEELKKSGEKHNKELPILTLTKEQSSFLVNKIYGRLIPYVIKTFNCALFACDEVIDSLIKQNPVAEAEKIKQLIQSIIAIPADVKGFRRITFEQWKACVSLPNRGIYVDLFARIAHVMNLFFNSQEMKAELSKLSATDQEKFYNFLEPIAAPRREERLKSGKKDFAELAPQMLTSEQTHYLLSLSPLVRNNICKLYNLIFISLADMIPAVIQEQPEQKAMAAVTDKQEAEQKAMAAVVPEEPSDNDTSNNERKDNHSAGHKRKKE